MTDDDTPQPYDLRPSGVVTVTAAGKQVTLRRPLLGEFRTLRESHHEANLAVSAAGAELRARLLEVNEDLLLYSARAMSPASRAQRLHVLAQAGDSLDPTRQAERARLEAAEAAGPLDAGDRAAHAAAETEAQQIMSSLDDASLDAWGGWTAEVLRTLAGLEVTADGLDPALCSLEFTVSLIEHWRSITPPRGR